MYGAAQGFILFKNVQEFYKIKKSVLIILPMFFLLFTICRYMYKEIYKNRCKCEQMALWASETIVNYISHRKQILKHFIFGFLTTIISCLL